MNGVIPPFVPWRGQAQLYHSTLYTRGGQLRQLLHPQFRRQLRQYVNEIKYFFLLSDGFLLLLHCVFVVLCVYLLYYVCICCILCVFVELYVYLLYLMCICCTMCVFVVSYVYLLHLMCICYIMCVFVVSYVYLLYLMCICCTMCVLLFLL